MKKQLSWVLATILFVCGTALTSCGDDDDDFQSGPKEEANDNTAAKAEVTYFVDLGANTLEFANVEVTYLDENGQSKDVMMTDKQWTLKRTITASQMPADFSLKVTFEQKTDVTPESDKDYEFGCVARIPFTVYNSKGQKICEHPGVLTETDGSHPVMKGSQLAGWWLTYALGINPDKFINFDKKTLRIETSKAVFNKMNYDYPYVN